MKLKYVELPPERIFNWLDPFNVIAKWGCKAITDDWWSEENVSIRRYFADEWIIEFDKLTGHFTELENSIKENGILTPISVMSGPPRGSYLKPFHYPPKQQGDLSKAIYTNPFGGSRLLIAQKLGIETIACAVHDYVNLFPDAEEITAKNYKEWFGDDYHFTKTAPHLRIKVQSHIKNAKFNSMNSHTRKAQQDAATIAREKTYNKYNLKGDA